MKMEITMVRAGMVEIKNKPRSKKNHLCPFRSQTRRRKEITEAAENKK